MAKNEPWHTQRKQLSRFQCYAHCRRTCVTFVITVQLNLVNHMEAICLSIVLGRWILLPCLYSFLSRTCGRSRNSLWCDSWVFITHSLLLLFSCNFRRSLQHCQTINDWLAIIKNIDEKLHGNTSQIVGSILKYMYNCVSIESESTPRFNALKPEMES